MAEPHPFEPNPQLVRWLARAGQAFATLYNGYEVDGEEHIPRQGPALIVAYHGIVPIDGFYFLFHHYLRTGRLVRGLVDRHVFRFPIFNSLFRAVGAIPGTPEQTVALLRSGHLVGVFPGGVREMIAGEAQKYKLVWKQRVGFARVALDAGVDIIPAFTENADEMYKAPLAGSSVLVRLYERTRLPIVPILGIGLLPFPVKVRTIVGPPVKIVAGDTPESLAARTRLALEKLIAARQPPQQTVLKAIRQRFTES